ncbi:16S rRNA (guanine(527)-N(7))-methyltransferase RsmG [Hoylesella nanceiensis]|jgi:16S rRNA methyltransferase gidB|uniref:Ribosomal RNA small subunit methyltransferase G n=1 Tax=Hoylesella nanceiensis TaxID=425941 RepID=A0ABS6YAA0_9BACT|nr:16S rRNA (guanine(527)-N(7))-methyltransferase RsmG [Hoylesella nanceiensis]MBF1421520.1 16S rRNA (guanine(527)-N(7))-methyltransferase RsmG [Hoylesella nanceiensis]MBF1439553.1 16S rRNA (guanine(527)-N(7))-methyltransferase RsmG [Hoylesella nanceiensis]MBF1441556.1 16S rRNA (guanine(527)-N(7))-methyltransferase RsmG [Hoylesella nanceiensis]MBW4767317.1 16S rRNA (guanine(527)-N(7))-methyltransferase RsmG [Hoylesella nanceiensis]MBW4768482.1 16S rRNA (guanine(527)-N(7))-methyltransferase Rsm
MNEILEYFPHLTDKQIEQFKALQALYEDWNQKINVISRKDISNLYSHHVLHSLAIAKAINFKDGTTIMDFGTGGGFPGIPLAIMFPNCKFKLIDGTGKKIMVANEVIKAIGLTNVVAEHIRGEEEKGKYNFIVSRAVMPLPDLIKIVKKNISKEQNNALPNGVIVLKGGNTEGEIHEHKKLAEITPLSNWFKDDWFKEKSLIYIPL